MATGMAIGSIIGALATTYSAVEGHNEAKEQMKRQDRALKQQEEEALKKGPEAMSVSEEESSMEEARKKLLRRGFLSTIQTGGTGLGTTASTGGTGLKGTLG